MKALLDKMEIDDLPSASLKEVARQIGISKVKELIVKCGGMVIYIPKTFNKVYCRKYIERKYNGRNAGEIADDLGITRRTVFRHLNAKL